jgi:hypothetical protein
VGLIFPARIAEDLARPLDSPRGKRRGGAAERTAMTGSVRSVEDR